MNAPRGTRPPQVADDEEATPSQKAYLTQSLSLGTLADKRDDFVPPRSSGGTDHFAHVEVEGEFTGGIDPAKLGDFFEDVDDTNPKDLIGITKPNLFLIPPAAEIYMALAMQDGAVNYGPYNWRKKKVRASIYISALKRHIADWVDGQENATDSKKPHLGHALACIAILVDAIETGNLVDDRPPAGSAPELIDFWTEDKKT